MRILIGIGIVMLTCYILISGCSSPTISKEKTSDIFIEKDQADQLDIDLIINYGQVNISAGANNWIEGKIEYNVKELKPKTTYKLKRNTGKITINQPKKPKVNFKKGKWKNDWDLQLTNVIPVHLNVNTGASDTSMNLSGMHLKSLDIETGVGRSTLNLGGHWEESFDVHIKLGVGESTIILPKDIGVEIKSTKGIGSASFNGFIAKEKGVYVNDAYDNADVIISVQTELGIGSANFELKQ